MDPDFAKQQLELMLRERYLHPNGADPRLRVELQRREPPGPRLGDHVPLSHRAGPARRDGPGLPQVGFQKLLLNFTWWVNRKDRFGKNVFEGGFLGLDNIGVFDRSAPLPTGGHLEQADGTAWMALFSQNMLELAIELAVHDPAYEDMALKFAEHFVYIASAMNRPGQDGGMWDEEDGFYYDLLRLPDGSARRLKVRSMVGLLPLCATSIFEAWQRERSPAGERFQWFTATPMPELIGRPSTARDTWAWRTGDLGSHPGRDQAPPHPHEDARRERVPEPLWHPLAVELSRAASVRLPGGRPGVPGVVPAGGVEHRHVRRQLQLARADLDAGERADHPGAR